MVSPWSSRRWLVITLTDCGVSRSVNPSGVAVVRTAADTYEPVPSVGASRSACAVTVTGASVAAMRSAAGAARSTHTLPPASTASSPLPASSTANPSATVTWACRPGVLRPATCAGSICTLMPALAAKLARASSSGPAGTW